MGRGLARSFQLDPDEARRAHALAAIFFLLVGSYTLVKTARDADFLAQLPVAVLPYVRWWWGCSRWARRSYSPA
jgi:hypothetical protein